MDSGYYAACTGLRARTQALELIAHNLANLNTTGYRAQQATFRSLLAGGNTGNPLNRALNDFGVLEGRRVDLSPGNLERTGNSFDLAIEGSGFFAVQTSGGTRYTRNGSFRVSAKSQLITAEGDLVLGEQGPVAVPSGTVSISADGTLSAGGAIAGKLRVVEFAPGTALLPEGTSYYAAPDGVPRAAAEASIRQGALESSNVNPIAAVAGLIAVQRQAEMLQRALSVFHGEFNRIAAAELPRI